MGIESIDTKILDRKMKNEMVGSWNVGLQVR